MMSTGFQFKQFFVKHDRCAMKVGTDGVLLGAWAPRSAIYRILDIGTGSGLIALMLAQRFTDAQIDAIDIDADACAQAAGNFASSPWADRLHATHCSLQDWQMVNGKLYDLIVSNPPYFVDSLKNPDAARSTARHNDTLPFGELVTISAKLLAPGGTLAIIVPAEVEELLQDLVAAHQLQCSQRCYVHPKPGRPAKRVLLAWQRSSREIREIRTEQLTLENEQGGRSEAYRQLTRDFYL
ncbi:MAG: methyltransferase [Paludibacteraceae bacterium]|nr:methyltransferase [Paludibacteraceae bacterium]